MATETENTPPVSDLRRRNVPNIVESSERDEARGKIDETVEKVAETEETDTLKPVELKRHNTKSRGSSISPHVVPVHRECIDSLLTRYMRYRVWLRFSRKPRKPIEATEDTDNERLDEPGYANGDTDSSDSVKRKKHLPRNVSYVSTAGFQNLIMIMFIMGNIRLIVENYMKYGFISPFTEFSIDKRDLAAGLTLYCAIPLHLFAAYIIERAALRFRAVSSEAFMEKYLWQQIFALHMINCAAAFSITSLVVYFIIQHPFIGTLCEIHSVIVCMKIVSYALTNRDLRDMYVQDPKLPTLPQLYRSQAYPENVNLGNLIYFWWAPTLIYQPVYPMRNRIHISFVFQCLAEMVILTIIIAFLTSQYAVPTLENSLVRFQQLDFLGISERLMKLATVSMIIWLLGFVLMFQSFLNFVAEMTRFGDRDFYQDWWNAGSVGTYWRLWNKPVTNYFRHHIFMPLRNRRFSSVGASTIIFVVSAVLHEAVVGIPTHNILGIAFLCMILQIPLIKLTQGLEETRGVHTQIGNCIFWLSFFLGQPFGVLLYYFAWNVKHGK